MVSWVIIVCRVSCEMYVCMYVQFVVSHPVLVRYQSEYIL